MPHIRVSEEQQKTLHSEKKVGESYADVLERVFDVEK